jgi:hypothetical protein
MSEADDNSRTAVKLLTEALESGDIPKIYFNNPVCFLNTGDISMLLQMSSKSVAVVNMSFHVAKTVAALLGSMIAEVEEKTGNKIMTINKIETALGEK